MRNGYFNYEKLGSDFAGIDPEKSIIPIGERSVDVDTSMAEYNKGADIFSTYKNFKVSTPKNTSPDL